LRLALRSLLAEFLRRTERERPPEELQVEDEELVEHALS
jgi:hypothetical protein